MFRRLSLLLLLLVPAPLAAQFTPFTVPTSDFWLRVTGYGGVPFGENPELYLLDNTGARGRLLWSLTSPQWDTALMRILDPGDVFGIEFATTSIPGVDDTPTTLSGDLASGRLNLRSDVGGAYVTYSLTTEHLVEPEPMTLALLATGLVGLGTVGWRRKRAAGV